MGNAGTVKLIAFDVDGTLTDGTLVIGFDGEPVKLFHARDGLGISLAHRMGYVTGFITGRKSKLVENRGKELQVDFILMGVSNKVEAMEKILKDHGLSWKEAAYMGDDLNDLPLMKKVGFSGSPADGVSEARKASDFVSSLPGGKGAAREFIETIMKSQHRWKEAVNSYKGKNLKKVVQ
ncbi:HAD family hydrolase [Dialister sp.]|jgi:3-deoxy-D-manno-octulosonate 8-phosphate phosphatase (KDO 8-P phosphatase)|uniref:KdsC family phosphatase n=1 Tax=Dialister sp. TaxID=1955814 RepID=UPI0025DA9947|nr:HAD-IIIA family hydrolase [Dialister sp.]